MKKVLLSICIIFSINSFSQDSVSVTLTMQARDIEYLSGILSKEQDEEFYQAVRHKFLVANPPTGVTNVTFDSTMYIIDVLRFFIRLQNDVQAVKNLCTSRVETILRALNNAYLTAKLDELDTADTNYFQSIRGFGRFRLNKKLN